MPFNGHLITAKLCYILYNHFYDRRILSFVSFNCATQMAPIKLYHFNIESLS